MGWFHLAFYFISIGLHVFSSLFNVWISIFHLMHYVNVYNGCSIFQLFFYFTNIKVIQIVLIYQLT